MEWLPIAVGGLFGGGGIGALFVFIATRKRDRASDIADRFEDASELAKYVDARVETIVAPIREELKRVKTEAHEFHAAVRTRETQLWVWDQRGRPGTLPMLPGPVLERLDLRHLLDLPGEDTVPVDPPSFTRSDQQGDPS